MTKLNERTTVKAKLAFEKVCNGYGVCIWHYHADNGLFERKAFKGYITKAQKYCLFAESTLTTRMEKPNR